MNKYGNKLICSIISILILASIVALCWNWLFMTSDHWVQSIPDIGTSSSPRAVDLNNDGVLDIIMGGGGREFTKTEFGVFALDGKTGDLLWSVPARNQVVGSPIFNDLNNDKISDVVIGGRSAILYAINGKSGKLIWEYLPTSDSIDIVNDPSILNFYNPQFIPDQDGDGIKDILTAYGGFPKAPAKQTDRPPGSLMVISSKSGNLLAKIVMPDKKETYMSPLVYDFNGDGKLSVLFGSGGETINGHFYKASLNSVLDEDLSKVVFFAGGGGKGFIAPPVLADVNGDSIKDIVVNAVNGKTLCFNGATDQLIWETDMGDEFEGYTMPSPGKFNKDNITDFFVSYGHGVWPNIDFAYQVLINGIDGTIMFKDTAGTFQYASPLTFDFTEDGHDDALVIINKQINKKLGSSSIAYYTNEIRVYDVHEKNEFRLYEQKTGSNLGSTPLLTDLDGDNYLDIIYCYMDDARNFYSFKSAKIERIETNIKVDQNLEWNAYMGASYDGTFQK